ncbi:MAG: hypothetical protein ACI8QZ_000782 [Chlamydiales bacterium]|jgi:hypothetical protein
MTIEDALPARATDNAAHTDGRVSGPQIVILTQFVKKSG